MVGEGSQTTAAAELKANVDTLLLIENERVLSIVGEDTSMLDAFTAVNEVLAGTVRAVVDIMTVPGLINLDFADVRAIMQDGGTATAGIGTAVGPERAVAAAQAAVANPLLDHDLSGAGAILLNVAGASGMTMREVSRAADVIRSAADPDAMIIFGTIFDDHLDDELRVTVIATRLRDWPRRRSRCGVGHALDRGDRGGDAPLGGHPDRDDRGRARSRRGIRGNRCAGAGRRPGAVRAMGGEPGLRRSRRGGSGLVSPADETPEPEAAGQSWFAPADEAPEAAAAQAAWSAELDLDEATEPAPVAEPARPAEPPWYDPGDEALEAARSAATPAFTAPEQPDPVSVGQATSRAPEPPPSQLARRTTQAVLTGVWKRLQKPPEPPR